MASPPVTVVDARSVQPAPALLDWPYPWREPPVWLRSMRQTPDPARQPIVVSTSVPERAVASLPRDRCTRVFARPCTVEQFLDCADLLLAQARALTRASHALRLQLGLVQERQSLAPYRRRAPRTSGPGESYRVPGGCQGARRRPRPARRRSSV
ncbi:MAG: hypothetical protein U0075_14435 [Thermomicrobiales bacterium]